MKVVIQDSFLRKFNRQVSYIAADKAQAARKFKNEVFMRIKAIPDLPYSNRKSIYFDDENIKDLIYENYVIVYLVDIKNDTIKVFGFVRSELEP